MAQSFLDTGQDSLIVPCLDIDHPVWREAGLGQRRSEKVGTCEAPQHFALGARSNPGGEERGGGTVYRAVTAARDLVQRAERQAFAGESRIHLGNSEGKHRFHALASAFDLFDLHAQRLYGGLGTQAAC